MENLLPLYPIESIGWYIGFLGSCYYCCSLSFGINRKGFCSNYELSVLWTTTMRCNFLCNIQLKCNMYWPTKARSIFPFFLSPKQCILMVLMVVYCDVQRVHNSKIRFFKGQKTNHRTNSLIWSSFTQNTVWVFRYLWPFWTLSPVWEQNGPKQIHFL